MTSPSLYIVQTASKITRHAPVAWRGLWFALIGVVAHAADAGGERPHIILIMTDQHKASATSVHGNPFVKTPTLEKLAAQGVTFEQAYSQSAICTPSRASIMTGTYPLVHRVLCHQNHAPRNLTQLPEILADGGYRCIVAGHYESDRSLTRGWHQALDWLGTPQLFQAMRAHYGCGSKEVGWASGETAITGDATNGAILNDGVFAMLDKIDPKAAPVFLHVAFIEPHAPYFAPRGYLDEESVRDAPLPEMGDLSQRPAWHRTMLREYGTDKATPADIRRLLAAYYGLVRYVDEQIGRLLQYLEKRGMTENAWIIITADHGDYAGEKGFFLKSESGYECLLHVPLIVRGPKGQWHAGKRVTEIVELLDLFPTILSMAGLKTPLQAQGHDLVGWMNDPNRKPLRQATFGAVGAYHGPLKTTFPGGIAESGRRKGIVRSARSATYSYIRDPDTGDEAYDLVKDPKELVNLLQNGRQPGDALQKLIQQMDEWEDACRAHGRALAVEPGDRNFEL